MQISRCHVQIFLTVSWTFYSIIGSSFKNIPAELAFASMVYDKGVPLDNCWGFVDGTVRAISRPGIHQRVLYNGHKIYHTLKFQSVVASNGLTANSHEPVEDKGHGNDMLMDSGLLSTSTILIWSKFIQMSGVGVSVEWIFGNMITYFKFLDFKKISKLVKCIW